MKTCKECGKEINRRGNFCSSSCYQSYYYKANKERLVEYKKRQHEKTYVKHPRKLLTPEEKKEYCKRYYQEKKEYYKEYYKNHQEHYLEYARNYYQEHKSEIHFKEMKKKAKKSFEDKKNGRNLG